MPCPWPSAHGTRLQGPHHRKAPEGEDRPAYFIHLAQVGCMLVIAGLGVAGAGLTLAMQGVQSNLVAGLTIVFTRPYRVGIDLHLRRKKPGGRHQTLQHGVEPRRPIKSGDPNRKIGGEIMHNYGDIRQVRVDVGIAYDGNIDTALAAVHETLRANLRAVLETFRRRGIAISFPQREVHLVEKGVQ